MNNETKSMINRRKARPHRKSDQGGPQTKFKILTLIRGGDFNKKSVVF